MLRTAMQRVFELDQGQPDPELTLKVLRALSTACGKLAGPCFFSDDVERTYDRSVERFVETYQRREKR